MDIAIQVADAAASRAGVQTWSITATEELALIDSLFQEVWMASGSQIAMPVNLLRALVLSGHYVAGAWREGELVGAAVGFMGVHDGVLELHSHVAGVARGIQAHGIGYALKLHQRAWSMDRSIPRVTWTFDPLIRRNAWFNLVKLGARAVSYHPDLYGIMVDDLNGTDETDRCLVHWDMNAPWPPPPPVGADGDALVLLRSDGRERPQLDLATRWGESPVVACQIPEDIVAIRRRDPPLAREWRVALRQSMGQAMQNGYVATSLSTDGWYRLENLGSAL